MKNSPLGKHGAPAFGRLAATAMAAVLITICATAARGDVPPPQPRFGGQPPPAPSANPSATAQERLIAAQKALEQAQAALGRATTSTHGGYVEKAREEVQATLADVAAALEYVKAHPEINKLANGPVTETARTRPTALPSGNRVPGVNMLQAMEALNLALNEFTNNTSPQYTGPVIGDLGGFRAKIMDGIGRATGNVYAGIQYAAGQAPAQRNPAATRAAPPTRATAPPQPRVTIEVTDTPNTATTVIIPRALLNSPAAAAATAFADGGDGSPAVMAAYTDGDENSSGTVLPSLIASLALSAAMILAGLHLISRRKLAVVPAALLLVAALLVTATIAHGNGAPPNRRGPLPAALPGQGPQVSGPVVVNVVEEGDSVRVIIARTVFTSLVTQAVQR